MKGKETTKQKRKQRKPSPTPLTDALLHVSDHAISFATPGHRGGRGYGLSVDTLSGTPTPMTFREKASLLAGALRLDQSVSIPQLGSLFERDGTRPVQQLKRFVAGAYDVPWAFISTNGTTALNVLAILTACPHGGRILLARDAHCSAISALIHGGLRPSYFQPEFDGRIGTSMGPTCQEVKAALDAGDRFDCLFLTSPNYFGIVGQIAEIITLAHERHISVIVDAAHAPHFHFCDALPGAAEDLGADLITQSTHKVANALSQGSTLLVGNENLLDPLYENIRDLGLVSTSFSYPILASVELGVAQLLDEGDAIWHSAIGLAEWFREQARHIPGIRVFGSEVIDRAGFQDLDRSRVALDVSGTGLTGFAFKERLNEERLIKEANFYPEMATLSSILFLITPGTSVAHARVALSAVERVAATASENGHPMSLWPPALPPMAMIPREAKCTPKQIVTVREAIGEPSGETISTYPPGAPIIVMGEIVTTDAVEFLQLMLRCGAHLNGASDPSFQTTKIVTG